VTQLARIERLAATDGQPLAYRRFDPSGDVRGSLVYLHGIQSHGGWYVDTAEELARRGYAVYLPDRRGSGLNDGPRGWFGSRRQLVADVGTFVEEARRAAPEAPVFVVAGCWGARPGLQFAEDRWLDIAGLVLVNPALRARVDLDLREKLQIGISRLLDERRPMRVPLEPELFTNEPDSRAMIRDDVFALREVTARFYFEMALWDQHLRRLEELKVPVLMLQATEDPIVDVDWVTGWFRRLRAPAKKLVLYADFAHILDFEPERARYWDDLSEWLDARTEDRQRLRRAPARGFRPSRIERADVLVVELPLRFSFGHALAARTATQNVFVRIVLDSGHVGYGEGVPREYVTGETVETAVEALLERQLPAVVSQAVDSPDSVPALVDGIGFQRPGGGLDLAARCAVELALLDAFGKRFRLPVQHWLGPPRASRPRYDGVIPFSSPRTVAGLALALKALGVRQVKLKVGEDRRQDLRCLATLRRWLGGDADIRVDANCAWTAAEAIEAMAAMREFRLSAVEQPLPAEDVEGLQRVTAAIEETVIADESLRTVAEAQSLAEKRACGAFNIRISKCGGLLPSLRIASIAREHGLDCVVGAQVGESGILSAAGRLLASTIAPRYLEGSGGSLLLKRDLVREQVVPGYRGRASVFEGPGLGVHVLEDVLATLTVRELRVTKGGT